MAASSTSSVRIVARIRPLLSHEHANDIVVTSEGNSIKIPNPKNEKELFTFPFNAVYPMESDQAQIFAEGVCVCVCQLRGRALTPYLLTICRTDILAQSRRPSSTSSKAMMLRSSPTVLPAPEKPTP